MKINKFFRHVARFYTWHRGYSIIPLQDGQDSIVPWEDYRNKIADEATIKEWLKGPLTGFGIIVGPISKIVVLVTPWQITCHTLNCPVTREANISFKKRYLYFRYPTDSKIKSVDLRATLGINADIITDGYVPAPSTMPMGDALNWTFEEEIPQELPELIKKACTVQEQPT